MSRLNTRSGGKLAVAMAAAIALSFMVVLGFTAVEKARAVSDDTYKYVNIFNDVLTIVDRDYVKEVKAKDLIYAAIDGMLSSLDPHTVFMPQEEFTEMRQDISGEFGGLGIEIAIKDGKLTVMNPIEDTPAWREGLKSGDWIKAINGEPTAGLKIHEAVQRMRGPVGTTVTITVVREGWDQPKDFTIRRELIKIRSVKKVELMKGGIGYIRLITFTENSTREVQDALKKLKEEAGGKFTGLILDLRSNPGGPLDQAVKVGDLFISEGVIVSVRGRTGEGQTFYAHRAGTEDYYPMIILVNSFTASAAEIVSGAIQDHGRALVLGVRSFGKGSVQQLRTLKDGSGLKITTAYYYIPSGRTIQEDGVVPDVVVDDLSPKQKAEVKEKGLEEPKPFRERNLQKHFRDKDTDVKDGDTAEPDKGFENMLPSGTGDDTDDYQLQRALDLIRDKSLFQAVVKKAA